MRKTLDEKQAEAVQRMAEEPTRAVLNGSQFGIGKTLITVELAATLGGQVNLFVVPVMTRKSWAVTIQEQYPDADVKIIDSRKAGKENLVSLLNLVPGWYIMGREYLMTANVISAVQKISPQIDFMAYDECQKWANRKSLGFRNMKKIKPKFRCAMSATPAGNRFQGMYAITKWLWPDKVPNSFWFWVSLWCKTEEDHFAGTIVAGEKNPGAYVDSLPCYINLEQSFGELIKGEVVVELSAKERKIYNTFEKALIVWLDENPLTTSFPHTKRIRLRQMTLGEVSYDPEADEVYFDHNMKSTKYDTLKELLETIDEPTLILTDSKKFASVVSDRLNADGHKSEKWTGDVGVAAREQVKQSFISGEIDHIVATIPAIGEGVDGLQHRARTVIWLSRSDNGILNDQAERRLYRRGQTRPVVSIDIVAEGTYDRGQLSKLIEDKLKMNRSLKKNGH